MYLDTQNGARGVPNGPRVYDSTGWVVTTFSDAV